MATDFRCRASVPEKACFQIKVGEIFKVLFSNGYPFPISNGYDVAKQFNQVPIQYIPTGLATANVCCKLFNFATASNGHLQRTVSVAILLPLATV